MGNRATAPPNRTANMSRVRAPRMIFVLNTKRNPSRRLWKMGSPTLVFRMGFGRMRSRKMNANMARATTISRAWCTPMNPMAIPPTAGPVMAPSCQAPLLQVAPLG